MEISNIDLKLFSIQNYNIRVYETWSWSRVRFRAIFHDDVVELRNIKLKKILNKEI